MVGRRIVLFVALVSMLAGTYGRVVRCGSDGSDAPPTPTQEVAARGPEPGVSAGAGEWGLRLPAPAPGSNPALLEIYEQDQADRSRERLGSSSIDFEELQQRDAERRAVVEEILARGGATTAADYYHAAMPYHHSLESADVMRAHELSRKAAELDDEHEMAKWLAAAALDRYLLGTGKQQRYGTQLRKVDGGWIVDDVDPSVSDEERARWSVQPLAEARARAAKMAPDALQ